MKLLVSILLLGFALATSAQTDIDSAGRKYPWYHNYHRIDTTRYYSDKITVIHTLVRTEHLKKDILWKGDTIFDDSLNKTSKLLIRDRYEQTISVATIPVNNVIIDDSHELIVCLSRAVVSPYQLVIYNFKGKLLFKKHFTIFAVVLDSLSYLQFQDSFPEFFANAKWHHQILQTDSLYYVDLAYWHWLTKSQQDRLFASGWIERPIYFRDLHSESVDGGSPIGLTGYTNFYSRTDPFYEFELQGDQIVGIILNDENGDKVRIPVIFD